MEDSRTVALKNGGPQSGDVDDVAAMVAYDRLDEVTVQAVWGEDTPNIGSFCNRRVIEVEGAVEALPCADIVWARELEYK